MLEIYRWSDSICGATYTIDNFYRCTIESFLLVHYCVPPTPLRIPTRPAVDTDPPRCGYRPSPLRIPTRPAADTDPPRCGYRPSPLRIPTLPAADTDPPRCGYRPAPLRKPTLPAADTDPPRCGYRPSPLRIPTRPTADTDPPRCGYRPSPLRIPTHPAADTDPPRCGYRPSPLRIPTLPAADTDPPRCLTVRAFEVRILGNGRPSPVLPRRPHQPQTVRSGAVSLLPLLALHDFVSCPRHSSRPSLRGNACSLPEIGRRTAAAPRTNGRAARIGGARQLTMGRWPWRRAARGNGGEWVDELMAVTLSLYELADLSIGHPEPGVVNFAALHSLLHALLRHLGIQQVQTEQRPELLAGPGELGTGVTERGAAEPPATGSSIEPAVPGPGPYRRLEQKLWDVERQVQELSRLPSALELLQRSRHDGKAVSDVWNLLQLRKNTEVNREGLDKAMSMMEEVMQEMNYMKKFKNNIEDRIKDIDKNIDSVTNQMASVNEILNKTSEHLEQFVSWKALQNTLVDASADSPREAEPSWTSQVLTPDLEVKSADISQATGTTDEMSNEVFMPQQTPSPTQPVHRIDQPSELHHPSGKQKRTASSTLTRERAELYPDTISALQRIRRASDNQPLLDQRVSALEKAFSELAGAADGEEGKGRGSESEDHDTPPDVAEDVKAGNDVRAEISDLRDMVKNIDEELHELRRFQPSSTEPGGEVQQQLDMLGSVLEKIMSSSCALLGMSLGLETKSTCPVCSLDVSQDASNLCQRFQKLQETVNALVDSTGEGTKDGVVKGRLQAHIQQLQAECEKLNHTTIQLLEDDRLQQRNIKSLFDSLSRLETKCGEASISQLQFDAVTDQMNKMIQGLLNKICAQEKDWNCVLEQLIKQMECKLDRIELDPLKKQLEDRWKSIRRQLQSQRGIEQDGAAGLRKQLISHFHCLSCDRPLDIKLPCSPSVITLPLPSYMTNAHRPQRSDTDPSRRRTKGWTADRTHNRSQLERNLSHMQQLHSSLCRQIDRVQNHFKGSVKAVSPFVRPLLQIGCPIASAPPRKAYESIIKSERITELIENFPTTARSCGGSHTLTSAHYRRCPKLYEPYPISALNQEHSTKLQDDSPTVSGDVTGPRGRSSCRLPSITGKDGSKCKPAHCPSQRVSATKLCSSRSPSAHFPTVVGSGPAFTDCCSSVLERDCCGSMEPVAACPCSGRTLTSQPCPSLDPASEPLGPRLENHQLLAPVSTANI
ncbi:uncharacterized protein [Narcine bancroftii]|uniref:uncharacterized protein n=1 Tax=Narcine bancroftii TaxID=1343680 RepID=UPI0038323395